MELGPCASDHLFDEMITLKMGLLADTLDHSSEGAQRAGSVRNDWECQRMVP
jgi:hypothetical protein